MQRLHGLRGLHVTILAATMLVFSQAGAGAAQNGVVIYGTDYDVFNIGRGDWQACERACEGDPRCAAWMFVRPMSQCRLKENVGPTVRNPCCVSDVRQHRGGESVSGAITTLHYNSGVADRGPCVKTNPGLPERFSGWACLWKDNPLYEEISGLLLAAFEGRHECRIEWEPDWQRGRSREPAKIVLVECTRNP